MFKKIRVLVVDDSAFMRKMVSDMLNIQPDIEVIDTAKNGKMAIDKAKLLKPDIITLDVEMPIMNGLEALKEIKKVSSAQVIMLSSLTSKGSSFTIEALGVGAFDFIQKPSGSISLDIDKVKDELSEKIRYAGSLCKKNRSLIMKESAKVVSTIRKGINNNINAIVIGASTGGPRVLYDILTEFPEDLGIPVFVVQHMPPGFTKAFAERLDKKSKLKIIEAIDKEPIVSNTVYIAPGGYHMTIENNLIKLDNQSPPIHGVRPAVDRLFISAANKYKEGLLGCILTGMGRDGADGIKLIKKYGGYTISQDESTSIVYGMPKSAYETGCIDIVLPADRITKEIVRAVKRV